MPGGGYSYEPGGDNARAWLTSGLLPVDDWAPSLQGDLN